MAFVLGFEDLGAALVLGYSKGIHPLSIRIWEQVQRSYPSDYNFAATMGVFMMALTGVAFFLQRRLVSKKSYATVTGKSAAPQQLRLGRWRPVAVVLAILYTGLAVCLPIVALLAASFSRRWTGVVDSSAVTVSNYLHLFGQNQLLPGALRNSLTLSVVTATGVMLLAVIAAYAIERARIRASRLVDVVLSVPVAVPGLALAVGVFSLVKGTPLFATIWAIAIAYGARYYPYGHRSVSSALHGIHPELEEASRVSGNGPLRTLQKVVVPLLRAGIASGWLLLFIMFMREVSMSNILYTSGTQTLSVALLSSVLFDPAGVAAAFACFQILLIAIPAMILLRTSDRRGGGLGSGVIE